MDIYRHLNHKESSETLISLLQLDPTPMDKELPPLPEEETESSTGSLQKQPASASTTTSVGLSGSHHGPIYYLTRIQRYSSYTFSVFASLHMINTSIIPLIYRSVPYSEPLLLMAREIYQTPVSEPLLIGIPVAAHVLSGIALRLVRRSENLKRYHAGATPHMYALHQINGSSTRVWPLFSYVSLSGYAFIGVLAAHVGVNRMLPLLVEGDSSNIGLQYVSHGFAMHGVVPWVAYTLLLSIGCGHMVWGWAKWMGIAPPVGWKKTTFDVKIRKRRRRTWWTINGVAILAAGIWAAGGLGVVARAGPTGGWLGSVYDNIYNYGTMS